VLKLRALRAECILKSGQVDPEGRSALELRVKYHARQWSTDRPVDALKEPLRAIAAHRPKDWRTVRDLPDFTKDTKKVWRAAALQVFAAALPFPNEIAELADQINDSDVTTEGQIKARIINRVGRAVLALAP
jgi:hypothetical protein